MDVDAELADSMGAMDRADIDRATIVIEWGAAGRSAKAILCRHDGTMLRGDGIGIEDAVADALRRGGLSP